VWLRSSHFSTSWLTKKGQLCRWSQKQWQSIQKLRSIISSFERVAFSMSRYALVADDNSVTQIFQSVGTSSLWFNKFTKGIGERMGSKVRKYLAVSSVVYNRFLSHIEQNIWATKTNNEVACRTSLTAVKRGRRVFLDIKGLKEHHSLADPFGMATTSWNGQRWQRHPHLFTSFRSTYQHWNQCRNMERQTSTNPRTLR